ncbi:MAG: phosphate starvation-inducible protein PsiF [Betaproteobacteria bacterium]|nr:phosphate starvation-inducible protein PsiF [Betaproteobacteria bacterium]
MRKLLALAFFAILSNLATAQTPQQEKMKACNADAAKKELKGGDRKKFMSQCLSAKKEEQADKKKELTAQQQKMKGCNAEAKTKDLKGDARKKFMSECLSK